MRTLTYRHGTDTPVVNDLAPQPLGPADLRIQVAATAINPVDNFVTSGNGRLAFGLPETVGLGWDAGGVVTEIGSGVTGFAVGDEVVAMHDDMTASARAHAESLVVAATSVVQLPDGLDLQQAATVPLNGLTARQGLDLLGPADDRSLLVTGAAGAVGGYAVALAARDGWRVTGHARSTDTAFLTRAGAHDTTTDLPGPVFDAVLDAAALQEEALAAVADGGGFVGVLPPQPVRSERGITVRTVATEADAEALTTLLRLAADGVLEPRVAGTARLEEAPAAYAKVAAGGHRGRWLLVP